MYFSSYMVIVGSLADGDSLPKPARLEGRAGTSGQGLEPRECSLFIGLDQWPSQEAVCSAARLPEL